MANARLHRVVRNLICAARLPDKIRIVLPKLPYRSWLNLCVYLKPSRSVGLRRDKSHLFA